MSDSIVTNTCVVCGGPRPECGYVHVATCEQCGAEYEYDECSRLTEKSIIALRDAWPRPIPVTERLPEAGDEAFAFSKKFGWTLARFNRGDYWKSGDDVYDITHWLPLPPDPTSDEE
jgi:hypothetical protein